MRNERKYSVTLKYSENAGRHTIEEIWRCRSLKSMKKVLCEALDLYRGEDGDPVEPDLEKLKANLGRYADDKFVEQEFRRMKKAYRVYSDFVEDVLAGRTLGPIVKNADRRTVIALCVL